MAARTAQDVSTASSGRSTNIWSQQGWALFQIDNRGQEGRGTAFQKPIYRAMG